MITSGNGDFVSCLLALLLKLLAVAFLVSPTAAGFASPAVRIIPSPTCNVRREDIPHRYPHALRATAEKTSVGGEAEAEVTAKRWLENFSSVLSDPTLASDAARWRSLFVPDANDDDDDDDRGGGGGGPYWRDMVSFTWNIVTHEGRDDIAAALAATAPAAASRGWVISGKVDAEAGSGAHAADDRLAFWCDFETAAGPGRAHVRLDAATGRAATVLTTLRGLHGRPFRVGRDREVDPSPHGPVPDRVYWHERRRRQVERGDGGGSGDDDDDDSASDEEKEERYVVILGGGQGGLSLGAHLRLLGVPYLILEAGPEPGSAWRRRYPSLALHDPVQYNHMPYLPFPESWPVYCPRDKLADWLEFYAKALDLDVRVNSKVADAKRMPDGTWRVTVQPVSGERGSSDDTRDGAASKKCYTIKATHVVFATGNSARPRIPSFPGASSFRGQKIHSSSYTGGAPYRGKRAVVVGSNNSGFDIAQDLWEQGAASVTMLQRTPSLVVSAKSILTHGLGGLYSEDAKSRGIDHEMADLMATTAPYKMLLPRWKEVTNAMRSTDAELHEKVARAGYRLDFGPDGMGVFAKSATEGGGFYIDVGCADLLGRGLVKVKCGEVERLDETEVVLKSGEKVDADVVIYATGFDTMDRFVADLCGSDIASKVGRTWGLGLGTPRDPGPWEGELRNMWKPTAVEGLWFHGGNLAQCRHYSRFLALQLAARYDDLDTHVYGQPDPTPFVSRPL